MTSNNNDDDDDDRAHSERSVLEWLDDDEPILAKIEDHFTLPGESNLVRFRNHRNAARVYDANGVQVIMEETYDAKTGKSSITTKRLIDDSFGASILRGLYTVVTTLFAGFLFVFCLQVLLFLILDLAVESGATALNSSLHVGTTIGVAIALLVFVANFSEAMVLAWCFVMDIWSGHALAKKFLFKQLKDVTIEWIFFVTFLLIPVSVMIVSLLAESGRWWSNTAIVWFGCTIAFFVVFSLNVIYFELKAAYNFVKNHSDTQNKCFIYVIRRCVLLRQRHEYSGKIQNLFLARSYFRTTEDTEDTAKSLIYEDTRIVQRSLWAQMTQKLPAWIFLQLEKPYRLKTIDDVQDYRPFMTSSTWGLEKVFCRPYNSRYIGIIEGPGALTQSQLRSSFLCSLIGTAMIVLLVVSFLVWFQIPGVFVAFVFFIALIFSWSALRSTRNLYKIGRNMIDIKTGKLRSLGEETRNLYLKGKDIIDKKIGKSRSLPEEVKEDEACQTEGEVPRDVNNADEENDGVDQTEEIAEAANESSTSEWKEEAEKTTARRLFPSGAKSMRYWKKVGERPSKAVFMVSEYYRINEARNLFCWTMVILELAVLYFYPLITLFMINGNLCGLFFVCATIAAIRHYVNIAVVVEEFGDMDLVGGSTSERSWENKSRLNTIIDWITKARSRKVWTSVLGACGLGFLAIFLGAIGSSTENTDTEAFTYLPNFTYPGLSDDMRYPTCTLSNIRGGFGADSTLLDFTFLSSIAYLADTQSELDNWFGPSGTEAIFDEEYVDAFREENDPENLPVFFKMIRFPQQKLGMIVIRGTSNNWDMLADTQLWSAAALMQGLRAALPAGGLWTPIIDQLVHWINTIQSESIKKVSFYTLTAKFAEFMKKDTDFETVQVTGHSLGGGLSMITGAQAKIPAIGLSGPNALISGASFNPPVSPEDMNKYTFNIIPNRDIVPMLDDKADQFQLIRCEAAASDFVGCHFARRSLCELMVTCGTGNRPAICECHRIYGYPKPVTDGDEDFDELCPVE